MSSEWKTASGCASEGLKGLAGTQQGIEAHAKREHWRDLGAQCARERKASGGGWEYHVSCLPEAVQREFRNRLAVEAANKKLAERASTDLAVAERAATALRARQRRVMEARAAVLREVDRRVFTARISRRKAILALVGDVA